MIRRAIRWLFGKRKPDRCSVFCPGCGVDLNAEANAATCTDTDLVRFTCGRCRTRSAWDFDAPVPLLIRSDSQNHHLVEHGIAVLSPKQAMNYIPAEVLDCQVAKIEIGTLPAMWNEQETY